MREGCSLPELCRYLFNSCRIQIDCPGEPYLFCRLKDKNSVSNHTMMGTRSGRGWSALASGMVDEDVDSLLRHVGPPVLPALGLLISESSPIGSTRLSGWFDDNPDGLGPLVHLRAPACQPEAEARRMHRHLT